MRADDLQGGFRLGEWLVEPRASRITGPSGTRALGRPQLDLLLELAGRHGEAVSRRSLEERAFTGQGDAATRLCDSVRDLRLALGGVPDDQHYIVNVGEDGLALIGHVEPLAREAAHGRDASADGRDTGRPTNVGRLQGFIAELRRRHVFRVTGAYLVGMWLVLQVAETTLEPLRLPAWWMTALTIIAVVGVPIVTVLAWSFEITPGGIIRDSGAPGGVAIPRPRRSMGPWLVAGVALMAAVTGIAWWRSIEIAREAEAGAEEAGRAGPDWRSIAVLPFVDLSPEGAGGYLGDGLSEELSMRLAQLPGLRVAARTSAFEYKGVNVDVRRIGQSLGVRHVLEGSVRRDGDQLRVTVQLIDASNGYHVWAQSYDQGWADVIAIQDDIARAVTDALKVLLAAQPGAQAAEVPAPDVQAFDRYLAGLALLRQSGDLSRLKEAAQRFREAIAIDADFARAHAGLCLVGVRLYDRTRDPADVTGAEQSCRRALALDPALIETEKALGALYLASGRHAEAEAIYRGLVARHPQDADGHIGLGRALEAAGRREEAEQSLQTAVQMEPGYWGSYHALGSIMFARGQVDEAVDAFREVTELTPASATAFNNLGGALHLKGDLEPAAEAFRHSLAIEPTRGAYSNLGTIHYFQGQFVEAAADYERATALAGQDQALWGNLADALWQVPGRREEAVGHYRRAIALARRELEIAPDDAVLVAQLAYYSGRAGDLAASRDYFARVTSADDVYVKYYETVAAADRGEIEAARVHAAEAVRLGYPESLLRADPSLAALTPK